MPLTPTNLVQVRTLLCVPLPATIDRTRNSWSSRADAADATIASTTAPASGSCIGKRRPRDGLGFFFNELWKTFNSSTELTKERNLKMTSYSEKVAQMFLATPTDLGTDATRDISARLAAMRADVFALCVKTKNCHWHISGPNFRDYHLMLDEQSEQIFAMTDPIAERARKLGGTTIRSISDIAGRQRSLDNNAAYIEPFDMLAELQGDNKQLVAEMGRGHELCDSYADVATASLLEVWIDETVRRAWFLYESCRQGVTHSV